MSDAQDHPQTEFRFSHLAGIGYGESGKHLVWIWRAALLSICIAFSFAIWTMTLGVPIRKHANQSAAMSSLRAIAAAQEIYKSTDPTRGYACVLSALGGDPKSGPPSPTSAQILRDDLAGGIRSGYFFNVDGCTRVGQDGLGTGYRVIAVPIDLGTTGNLGYCTDQSGNLKVDPKGGIDCTQTLID